MRANRTQRAFNTARFAFAFAQAGSKCAPLLSPATNIYTTAYIAGTLSIVDAGFECRGCQGRTARPAYTLRLRLISYQDDHM